MAPHSSFLPPLFLILLASAMAGLSACRNSHDGQTITLITPAGTHVATTAGTITANELQNQHVLVVTEPFPLTLTFMDPQGASVQKIIAGPIPFLKIPSALVTTKDSNPTQLTQLPRLCPRADFTGQDKPTLVYQGTKDPLARIPTMQLAEEDLQPSQLTTLTQFDCANVLTVTQASVLYDYEDPAIVEYAGPSPLTGKQVEIHEHTSGFYANFHIAVISSDQSLQQLDKQTILHMAQGTLADIDKTHLTPRLRTHSFLPGPYASHRFKGYQLCEWGDSHLIPQQEMAYQDIALWDWDYGTSASVWVVVWEGDEEDWLILNETIDPFYLTDDLIAVLRVERSQTLKETGLTLTNPENNFSLTLKTGQTRGCW